MTTHTTSNRKPATWSSPILALALALLGPGCDALSASPGHDFGLTILSPTPLTLVGQITAPIRFAVTGCTAFDTAVRTGDAGSHGVEVAPQADGTWLATVPVEWLREEDRTCLDDALAPHLSQAQLLVTCRDAGRTVAAELAVAYATSTRAYRALEFPGPLESVRYVFPGVDPLLPFALGLSPLGLGTDLFPHHLDSAYWADFHVMSWYPLVRPRLAANASSFSFSMGINTSWTAPRIVVSPSTTVASEWLQPCLPEGGDHGCFKFIIPVPARIIDLAYAADGALMVLSSVLDDASPYHPLATVLTRVALAAGAAGFDVTVLGHFPGEQAQSRFSRTADGRLAFLTAVPPEPHVSGKVRSVLHTTEGLSVDTMADPSGTLDSGIINSSAPLEIRGMQLSPDANSLVAYGGIVGSLGGTWERFPTTIDYPGTGDGGGAVWLTDAVALWRGDRFLWSGYPGYAPAGVEVFELTSPHALRYAHEPGPLPGTRVKPRLFGATAVGDKLVLTTNTGLRVLGPDGALIGGADPLPCGLEPTALAVQVGPTTAAVGAGDYLYVFDLADPAP